MGPLDRLLNWLRVKLPKGASLSEAQGADMPLGNDALPRAFGYKMAWLALPTEDGAEVMKVLGLKRVAPCTWAHGIAKVYRDQRFVFCDSRGEAMDPCSRLADVPPLPLGQNPSLPCSIESC